ncbi:unnamed protein product [Zymoseptoria tritici ST99CH_1A5]|uniref:Mitochondrial intermembrane space import and assembly protein 40 n=4 Tax=Zymoseptoria tritici TaxID=1047171 RepID=A0A1X7S569_ZYMT9|nr:unnamed protein product [Zymoseptoria tritici ST99CH_3D7]SMR59292.1 unnamed protein product [Zymoseptoria tritici ST99CH_1E4]SMY28510.1 unnamed protein product [Zymoseptoria tritici ST99CH_1A5]
MFRPAFRAASAVRLTPKAPLGKRFASTATRRSGSWKGTALRWTAAGAIVYYYNTATVFAEEPERTLRAPLETAHESESSSTIEAISAQRRAQARTSNLPLYDQKEESSTVAAADDGEQVAVGGAEGGPEALEEEAEQQGAFNEETGEINWDCPCLGGMAHGPCGEQFRAAFSCFVYSKEEPKGVECIEHFKTMQNCFREHPEIYGSELDDDEVAEVQAEEDRAQAALQGSDEGDAQSALPSQRSSEEEVPVAQAVKADAGALAEKAKNEVSKPWQDGRESKSAD